MSELHLLGLLADHDEKDDAKQNAGRDQHFPIGQPLLEDEREDSHHAGKEKPQERALQNNAAAETQIVTLEKKHHLEAFAIKRGEPEQDQSPPETGVPV